MAAGADLLRVRKGRGARRQEASSLLFTLLPKLGGVDASVSVAMIAALRRTWTPNSLSSSSATPRCSQRRLRRPNRPHHQRFPPPLPLARSSRPPSPTQPRIAAAPLHRGRHPATPLAPPGPLQGQRRAHGRPKSPARCWPWRTSCGSCSSTSGSYNKQEPPPQEPAQVLAKWRLLGRQGGQGRRTRTRPPHPTTTLTTTAATRCPLRRPPTTAAPQRAARRPPPPCRRPACRWAPLAAQAPQRLPCSVEEEQAGAAAPGSGRRRRRC